MTVAATAGGSHRRSHAWRENHPSFAAAANRLKHSEAQSSDSIHKLVAAASVKPVTSPKRMSGQMFKAPRRAGCPAL